MELNMGMIPNITMNLNPNSVTTMNPDGTANNDSNNAVGNDPKGECQTCKNRKYQDGSDEMVSFKSASHISPEAAPAMVRSHEQEHVTNAFKKASQNNGKVVSASVTLKTDICPECGRSYIAGGTTRTQIKYYNEENPYQKALKTQDASKYAGMNVDMEK